MLVRTPPEPVVGFCRTEEADTPLRPLSHPFPAPQLPTQLEDVDITDELSRLFKSRPAAASLGLIKLAELLKSEHPAWPAVSLKRLRRCRTSVFEWETFPPDAESVYRPGDELPDTVIEKIRDAFPILDPPRPGPDGVLWRVQRFGSEAVVLRGDSESRMVIWEDGREMIALIQEKILIPTSRLYVKSEVGRWVRASP